MLSSIKHRNNKQKYYLLNYLSLLIPDFFYRNNLRNKLNSLSDFDFEYIKNIAAFAKRSGAKSLGLISALGANKNSLNTYLKVKGKTEEEIMSLGFEKVIIARPGHLLGKRKNESINPIIFIFEMITNITGMLLLGPLKKFKNIASSKVASAIIEKINTSPDGVYFLDYDDFRNY